MIKGWIRDCKLDMSCESGASNFSRFLFPTGWSQEPRKRTISLTLTLDTISSTTTRELQDLCNKEVILIDANSNTQDEYKDKNNQKNKYSRSKTINFRG